MAVSFSAHYAALPPQLFRALPPTPVSAPSVIAINDALAEVLGLNAGDLHSADGVALLAGNSIAPGSQPLAMAYSGHQFGHWSGQLGDGRALLLGERRASDGQLYDIQLKGAGRTPFSRSGDGRSALGPVLREYILSEAMAALGVPTTRALAALRTGDQVQRHYPEPGGIFTRVAKSHVRVGTFQHFAAAKDTDALNALTRFCLDRLYPGDAGDDIAANARLLLEKTIQKQADLVAKWMSLGFIHGVMNTDNMAISGETIDYGPCAFMEAYDPRTVFSSIDHQGRYAYTNQPGIAHWNLSCLASALVPLLDADQDAAVAIAQASLDTFPDLYDAAYTANMSAKLGLMQVASEDQQIISGVLEVLKDRALDFTSTMRAIATGQFDLTTAPQLEALQARWDQDGHSAAQRQAAMKAVNPAYIPRNHQVEKAISASAEDADDTPFHRLNAVLAQPFVDQLDAQEYAHPAEPHEAVRQTFCGT